MFTKGTLNYTQVLLNNIQAVLKVNPVAGLIVDGVTTEASRSKADVR